MTPPPPTLQARAAAIAPLRRQGERLLGRLLRRTSAVVVPRVELSGGDPFLEVGRRLRVARESRGLSLRQLAQETRISITVLEALEKGWRDRLPEPAYMRTMLALLEQHLALDQGSLAAALPLRTSRSLRSSLKAHAKRVPLTSIALFATWQGALLYALLCLLLIYGLNRQQERLVTQGLLPLRSVPARPAPDSEAAPAAARDRARVLDAYPDLRPLERASRGLGLELLRRQLAVNRPMTSALGPPVSTGRPQASGAQPASEASSASAATPPLQDPEVQDPSAPALRP